MRKVQNYYYIDEDEIGYFNKKDIQELYLKMKSGNVCAKEELTNIGLLLVDGIAQKEYSIEDFYKGIEIEDLKSAGSLAFLDAIVAYDETKGSSFFTYAANCVRRSIRYNKRMFLENKNAMMGMDCSFSEDNILLENHACTRYIERESIETYLAILSTSESRVLELRYGLGIHMGINLPFDMVAETLGVTIDSVKVTYATALDKIRCHLSKETSDKLDELSLKYAKAIIEEKLTIKQIATKENLSKTEISNILARLINFNEAMYVNLMNSLNEPGVSQMDPSTSYSLGALTMANIAKKEN